MGIFSDVLLTADYDRTLTAPDSTIPERNLTAIRYFIDNGGVFTINTGRSVPMTKVFRDRVPVNAPLLLYNGSAAYDLNEKKLSFSLTAQTSNIHRNIHIMCEDGEIHGDELDGTIRITHFRRNKMEPEKSRVIRVLKYESGHGGGDAGIMEDFTAGLQQSCTESRSSISRSVESHLMACAIEQARVTGTVVDMEKYRNSLI